MSGMTSKNDASGFKQKGGAADILNAVNMEVTQDALLKNVNEELQETARGARLLAKNAAHRRWQRRRGEAPPPRGEHFTWHDVDE